jgi:hypothetical protein
MKESRQMSVPYPLMRSDRPVLGRMEIGYRKCFGVFGGSEGD